MPAVEDTVRDFIVANFLFGDTTRAVRDDDSLLEHGIIDSTGILELVFFLETTYGIAVDDKEMIPANLDSIAKVAGFVGRKTDGTA
jgi:acyl carrier protein